MNCTIFLEILLGVIWEIDLFGFNVG
jgi:hypothetical protein